MGYLDKNINMTLIILVVGIVIVMLGVTVFFQIGLESRTTDLDTATGNLSACTTQVANYQDRLEQCNERAESAVADIESYDKIYEQKVAELGETEDELDNANERVQTLSLIQTGLETQVNDLRGQRDELQQSVNQLDNRIDDLDRQVRDWRSRFLCCEGSSTIDECQSNC